MNPVKAAAAGFGVAFGFLISWGQFADPDRIRAMLLLDDLYLYGMMGSAVLVATIGARLLRRRRARSLLAGRPVDWDSPALQPRHVAGSAVFGLGWAITDSCPGPIAVQLTQGVPWALFTTAGVLGGVWLYLRRSPATAVDEGSAIAR